MQNITPKDIVKELDSNIVGQEEAKKAVAIALRNRWRRMQLTEDFRDEVLPKNILMVGATGVGKTEIARRLAKFVNAPFIKVEATKFTEIGYVGRDVEQIIRDLLDISIRMINDAMKADINKQAEKNSEERILDALSGTGASAETREKFRKLLYSGELNDRLIEINVKDSPAIPQTMDIPGIPGAQMGMVNFGDLFSQVIGKNRLVTKKMTVKDAFKLLTQEEAEDLIDQGKVVSCAIEEVEQNGIVFIDEIDKICAVRGDKRSSTVSQEGVQRDLLPIIEGTAVSTKYGQVKTNHILFIASGAFHMASPSDLLPELQGRLPIRVDLLPLTHSDFVRILQEPKFNLIKQFQVLLATDGIELSFEEEAIHKIASIAVDLNDHVENIGARRLYTVLERLLSDLSFDVERYKNSKFIVTKEIVEKNLSNIIKGHDLQKFVL